ncbi:conditioned medium-induced protein 4 [Salinibaculum salinum]|uniref:conditioned medium-induced protein 4 n=1 Tax=Salinibaculum salinum TaxID=3131996 RepID=UPI0030EE6F67
MDDKTAELRDIFIDVADGETVTESQTEQRGSLLRDESVDERLADVIDRMRERFDFQTSLATEELCTIVTEFYDGKSDDGIATVLKVPRDLVFDARMDLHLVRDEDTGDIDTTTLRARLAADEPVGAVAADLDAKSGDIEQAVRAVRAENRSKRVSQRFRTEFEEILTDADIADHLTADVQDDGLDEATEGLEVDVEF